MSTLTLEQAIKPSRSSVVSTRSGGGKAAKGRKGEIELPDYVAPEPKNATERREWDRMSSRMEGAPRLSLPFRPCSPKLTSPSLPCRLPLVLCASSNPTVAVSPAEPRHAVRHSFRQLFELSDGSFEKRGMSVRDFMRVAEDFNAHLGFHHGIEEQ